MRKRLKQLIYDTNALSSDQIDAFYRTHGKFDNIFVINMANREERLRNATRTLKKVGLDFERFVAISGKDLNERDDTWTKQFPLLRPGELGCLLSHLSIIALAASHNNENNFTLIFEDDVVTSSSNIDSLFEEISDMDEYERVDIIYLGKCLESCGKITQIKDNIFRAATPSCTHALIIRNSYARKLLKLMDNCDDSAIDSEFFNRGIDSIHRDLIVSGIINGIVIHPAIFYQDVITGSSDLRQEFMINYQECNDTNPCIQEFHPPCDDGPRKRLRNLTKFIIIIIVLIIILIIIGKIMKKRGMTRGVLVEKFKSSNKRKLAIVCLIIIIVIILLIFIVGLSRREPRKLTKFEQNKHKPEWLKDYTSPPNPIQPTLLSIADGRAKHFEIDRAMLASKEYKVFNPNGFFSFDNHGKLELITANRCCYDKVSYPLLQIFDRNVTKIIDSRKILVESDKPMKSNRILGFEDMRIFLYNEKLYMIGVNLDRSVDILPSMCLVKLDSNYRSEKTWHLNYPPLIAVSNKNWSPLELPLDDDERRKGNKVGELGFIVDIDPLLIVKRKIFNNGMDDANPDWNYVCEAAYSYSKQTKVSKLRNSTITYKWSDIPKSFQETFSTICFEMESHYQRYILMGHTKYVESDFIDDAWLVTYQHYFVIIDLPIHPHGHYTPRIFLSKSFHVEQENRPHIEYISGFAFNEDKLIVMYGFQDVESRYIVISDESLKKFIRDQPTEN